MKIQVYMQDERVFQYEVQDEEKAREHAHRIINYGWRTVEDHGKGKEMVYYPVHQILKVKFETAALDFLMTKYEARED